MSLFQCDKCGCVENTSFGRYHTRNMDFWKLEDQGQKLCSACAPTHYATGKPAMMHEFGKWHGRFERKFLPKGMYETGPDGNLRRRDTKKYHEEDERDVEWCNSETGQGDG